MITNEICSLFPGLWGIVARVHKKLIERWVNKTHSYRLDTRTLKMEAENLGGSRVNFQKHEPQRDTKVHEGSLRLKPS